MSISNVVVISTVVATGVYLWNAFSTTIEIIFISVVVFISNSGFYTGLERSATPRDVLLIWPPYLLVFPWPLPCTCVWLLIITFYFVKDTWLRTIDLLKYGVINIERAPFFIKYTQYSSKYYGLPGS